MSEVEITMNQDVDLVALAKKNGDEAYEMAKEWGWSEERAERWRKIWSLPLFDEK